MKDLFKKIKEGLLGTDGTGGGSGQQGVITAQELVDQAFEHFKMRLQDSSTDMSLLFPTSFVIYLNPEDYAIRKQEFPRRAPDIKKKCLIEVRKRISDNPEWHDYIPHSKYWKIQFVEFKPECVINTSDGNAQFSVEKGHVMIVSDLYANDLGESIGDSASSGGRVVTTVHNMRGTTSLQNLAINPDAFKDVTRLGENSFRLEFLRSDLTDNNKSPKQTSSVNSPTPPANKTVVDKVINNGNTSKQSNPPQKHVTAELQVWDSYFLVNGQKTDKYVITSERLQITGPSATTSTDGAELLKIDNDSIMNPHLNIRYDAPNKRFLISAVGDTKLNQKILERNPDNWSEMPNNSTILLNGDIQLNFILKNV